MQLASPDPEGFIFRFGFIPLNFNLFNPISYIPMITSIFLHGGWFHVISNLWFLHIFGDNVEEVLGIFYPIFYLLFGVAAVFSHLFFNSESVIPMVGASGAISGVVGFYYVFFNKHRIKTLVPLFGFYHITELPVWFFLGYWFVIQIFSGIGDLAYVNGGGVAFFLLILEDLSSVLWWDMWLKSTIILERQDDIFNPKG